MKTNLSVEAMVRELQGRTPIWKEGQWCSFAAGDNVTATAVSFEEAVAMSYDRMKLDQDEQNSLAGAIEGHERARFHVNLPALSRGAMLRLVNAVLSSPWLQWWLSIRAEDRAELESARYFLRVAVESYDFRRVVETYVRRRVHKAVTDHAAALKAIPAPDPAPDPASKGDA